MYKLFQKSLLKCDDNYIKSFGKCGKTTKKSFEKCVDMYKSG